MARRPRTPKGDRRDDRVDLAREAIPSDAPADIVNTEDREHLDESERLIDFATDRMEEGWSFWNETYKLAREDVRFMYEDQWPDYAKAGRENRPMLTMNQLPQYAQQVVNNARRSKFAIQVKQLSGRNDLILGPDGYSSYSRSQVMEGLVRDIEDRSQAHEGYCDTLQHQIEGGFGWMLVKPVDNIDDPFDIELRIEQVKHRYSAMLDPNAKRADRSDAMWCSVAMDMPLEEFKVRWPDVTPQDMNTGTTRSGRRSADGSYFHGDANSVRIADFWWKQAMERTAFEFIRQGEVAAERLVLWEDEHEDIFDELKDQGFVERNRKTVDSYKIRYMRFVAGHILGGPYDWQSKHLPLVLFKGRELNLESRDVLVGMFRYAHDPQRMVNFWTSAATEKIALVPRSPFIAAVEQIANQEDQWTNMYQQNTPVLLYNHLEGVPPPQRQNNVAMAQGELQLVTASRSLLQDTIGIHDANLGRRSNEVSGVALQERQEQGELGAFDFIDNLARGVRRVGEILLDMIPRCYTTDYARRVVLPDDTDIFVDLNLEMEDEETGRKVRVFTLDYARYSCRVDVGAASKTQREEFVKMMIEWGRSDPEGFPLFRDLIVENMDVPQARVISQRMKGAVPRHLLSPQDRERIPPPSRRRRTNWHRWKCRPARPRRKRRSSGRRPISSRPRPACGPRNSAPSPTRRACSSRRNAASTRPKPRPKPGAKMKAFRRNGSPPSSGARSRRPLPR